MCIDYQYMNKVNILNKYLMSRADDIFDKYQGEAMFTMIDLRKPTRLIIAIESSKLFVLGRPMPQEHSST